MGFVTLPISGFLYWLMLRSKKESPFPKWGLLRLLIAGAVCVILAVPLNMVLSGIISFSRLGVLTDPAPWISAFRESPASLGEMIREASKNTQPTFFQELINMFFTAGLLEEGLKFFTCRIAVRKEGMIRTWMDCVVSFAIVGITFEFLENIVFGMDSDFISAFMRSVAAAHFVFGVIMGWFYGKYRVTGQKKNLWLSVWVPVVYHTVTNALIASATYSKVLDVLGTAAAISHIVAAVIAVIIVLLWQKNKTLDVPVRT